jgi:ubiquinol-cytochrome c reductase iron-sulfur subunit
VTDETHIPDGGEETTRRDFIYIAAGGTAAIGGVLTLWPFIDQMNPAADTLAQATTEVNVGALDEGVGMTVMFRSRPHFVRRRTAAEIAEAAEADVASLPDRDARNVNIDDGSPATMENRSALTAAVAEGVEVDQALATALLVTGANCTHLGCVPTEGEGDYDAWFCPCHGSHYDTAGRIRRGPAPENLPVPPMTFTAPTTLRLG